MGRGAVGVLVAAAMALGAGSGTASAATAEIGGLARQVNTKVWIDAGHGGGFSTAYGATMLAGTVSVGGARFTGKFAVEAAGLRGCEINTNGGDCESPPLAIRGRDVSGKYLAGSCVNWGADETTARRPPYPDGIDRTTALPSSVGFVELFICQAQITGGANAPFVLHVDLVAVAPGLDVNNILTYLDDLAFGTAPYTYSAAGTFHIHK